MSEREIRFGVTPATRAEVRRIVGSDPVADDGLKEHTPAPGDDAVLVVARCPGPHTASSHIERCADCGHRVWVSATALPYLVRVCTACLPKRLEVVGT